MAAPAAGAMLRVMDRILIAIDGSPGAREALETGLALARGAGAIATVVYVRHAPLPVLGDPYYQRSLSQELMQARVAMADAEALAATMGVEIEPEVLEGHPARCVLDLAEARGAGLIVVGSRGRRAIAGARLGSVSAEVVQKAKRPVLVAKQRSRARLAA
jgi:nucleotide-binding universal stress UspA family protein